VWLVQKVRTDSFYLLLPDEFLSEATELGPATNHDHPAPTPQILGVARPVQSEMLFGVNNDVANQCFRRIDA
jgi:hypothetical protein